MEWVGKCHVCRKQQGLSPLSLPVTQRRAHHSEHKSCEGYIYRLGPREFEQGLFGKTKVPAPVGSSAGLRVRVLWPEACEEVGLLHSHADPEMTAPGPGLG